MVEAENLGAERDMWPLPVQHQIPWAEGDAPHGESIDLNEYPVELLRLKKCRSFRADLLHKLTIILRAHGGYGMGHGVARASKILEVSPFTFLRWLKWEFAPRSRVSWERVDNLYEESIARLVADKLKKK